VIKLDTSSWKEVTTYRGLPDDMKFILLDQATRNYYRSKSAGTKFVGV